MPGAERRPQRHERADPEDETACRDGKRAERRGARMGETVHIQHSVVIDRAAVAGLREEEIGPQATADEADNRRRDDARSEEHTSELQSLMRISYAVFGLKT